MIINFLLKKYSQNESALEQESAIVSTTETQGSFDRVNRDGYEKEWST